MHYDYDQKAIINLKGQVVYRPASDESASIYGRYGDYMIISQNSNYGLIDLNGNVIVPPRYDRVGNYSENVLSNGYVYVQKEYRFGYLDASGNLSCPIKYSSDYNHSHIISDCFAYIENLDGTYTVISAAVGALPESYSHVFYSADDSPFFGAIRTDDTGVVVDLQGETLLEVSNARSMYVNREATRVLAYVEIPVQDQDPEYGYALFHLQP